MPPPPLHTHTFILFHVCHLQLMKILMCRWEVLLLSLGIAPHISLYHPVYHQVRVE